jgi:hypothetical protein
MDQIATKPTSNKTMDIKPIILRQTKTTRLLFCSSWVDPKLTKNPLRGGFRFQKKSPIETWKDFEAKKISNLKKDEEYNLNLDGNDLAILFENLEEIKETLLQHGHSYKPRKFEVSDKKPEEIMDILGSIASDSDGKEKIKEVVKNYKLFNVGDIDEFVQKKEAVKLFDKLLNSVEEFSKYRSELGVEKDEEVWQRFFSNNSWILGSDFVEILDERRVDVENITDYLLKSYDGFVDIVELKLPSANFWTNEYIPTSILTKAVMQCNRYILETERRMNDFALAKKLQHVPIAKPRITLIYSRSNDWIEEHREAYRVLNSSYVTLNIITYDHLLERAKRLVGLSKIPTKDLQ